METMRQFAYVVLLLFSLTQNVFCRPEQDTDRDSETSSGNFYIGVGIGDITGPAADVNMMGYADPSQVSGGIHLKQYSRAYIIADINNSDNRVLFISADNCMGSQIVKLEVLNRLKKLYGNTYTERNLCLSGTHTHSGPGGFQQYVLFDITSLGFVYQNFEAIVEGIVKSVKLAHNNLKVGNILINEGELLDSNINRSPTAYANNPAKEKQKYKYNVDKTMLLLKLLDSDGKDMGMINWFAVHCTSMNNTNKLISSDNKGYASYLFEQKMNDGVRPGQGSFVAAFAQSNEGDVSPNTRGPHCQDTGLPCDVPTSTCNGKSHLCVASGPGRNMMESTEIIGRQQYDKALALYDSAEIQLNGSVSFIQQFVNMSDYTVYFENQTKVKTCKPSMGFSFAAGTTDGPGAFNFTQGSTEGSFFWDAVRDLIHKPSEELVECQKPKPILLPTGEIKKPYDWHPDIVDTQIFKIGNLAIVAVPGEFTTMSGRRLRDAVKSTLIANSWPEDTQVVIAGLSNVYTHYIATFEEYQIQRYEGASTIYGPHTLEAYIQQYKILAEALAKGKSVEPGPSPPFLLNEQISLLPPVIFDRAPWGSKFGDVTIDVRPKYTVNSTVMVSFVTANPRNSPNLEEPFLSIDLKGEDGKWRQVYNDADWCTRFKWDRTHLLRGESQASIYWEIPATVEPGVYRIKHFGYSKHITGSINHFIGTSSMFEVTK
ncbi:putative neutral ceramidase C [Ptychodera flava]|uniref:putative neutral ceramidase C n=1 Tax=Ptychodera flava TaxID=63121 RepID=UPI00396A2C5C